MGKQLGETVRKVGVEGALDTLGGVSALGGAAMSFIEAARQRKLQLQAEKEAAKAFEEAKRQISVNPFEALAVNKQPYEFQREALLSSGAQATEAGAESERGVAATAGRVQLAQNEAQQGIQTAMSKEMSDLDKLTAEEETNIKSELAGLSLEEAKGYQEQAAEAKKARAQSIEGATKSITTAGQKAISTFVPLYLKNKGIDPTTGLPIQSAGTAETGRPAMPNANQGFGGFGTVLSAAQQAALLSSEEGKKLFQQNPFLIH